MFKNTRFGKYSGKHSRLCLKLTYTAEKETGCVSVAESNFPFYLLGLVHSNLFLFKTFHPYLDDIFYQGKLSFLKTLSKVDKFENCVFT